MRMAKVMVGKTSDIGEGKMTHLTVGGKEILIANVGGQVLRYRQHLQSRWS